MRLTRFRLLALVPLVAFLACAPAPARNNERTGAGSAPKTLMFGVRYELNDIAPKITSGTSSDGMKRLFTASLAYMDGRGAINPYLAERLPALDTDSWRVLSDGRMETTYRLRPSLSWHDGHPLTADDFVFALGAYRSPGVAFNPVPQDRLDDVLAPDPHTLVFRWKALYPDAGSLRTGLFEPLPRHLLEQTFSESTADELNILGYWTRDYVHAGPYRLEQWIPGTEMDAAAFDGHALGKPKIDRIIVKFVPDENTMLTNLLAGAVQIATDNSLRFEHSLVLKREWANGNGTVLIDTVQPRISAFQMRPEYANPGSLLDVRVRRAIAYAHDRQAIVDGLFSGEVPISDHVMPRSAPYFDALDREVTKYPYDLGRTDQLLSEVGIRKGPDGAYVTPTGERFGFASWVLAGSQNERQGSIMGDSWRRAGFDVKEYILPTALSQDGQVRATYPALSHVTTFLGEINNLNAFTPSQVPRAANQWRGLNRGGWTNADYERVWDAFNSTLDRSQRDRQVIEMMKIVTDELPVIFNFHNPVLSAFLSSLNGPALGTPDSLALWNVHEWELQ